MQVDMLRAPRTAKKNTRQKEKLTTISTVSSTLKEKDQTRQVRFFISSISIV
jgi:hypothetical protein